MATRIALVTNTLKGGGIERATINIANQLSNHGYVVDLLLAVCKGDLFDEVNDAVNIVCLDNKKTKFIYRLKRCPLDVKLMIFLNGMFGMLPKSIRAIHAIRGYLIKYKPEILISSPSLVNVAAVIACADVPAKPKLLVGEMTTLSKVEKYQNKYLLRRLINDISSYYGHADKIICISEGARDDLTEHFNVPINNCVVVGNPIDEVQLFEKSKQEDDLLFDLSKPYFLAVGRLEVEKEFSTLILAFSAIADKTDINLLIIGEGSLRVELEDQVEELGIKSRVFLLGFVSNPYPYIRNCELLVLSSSREGLPNVILEAIVFNKKIVATDCSRGVADILSVYVNGQLVPVGNVSVLSDEMLNAVNRENYKSNVELPSRDYLDLIEQML